MRRLILALCLLGTLGISAAAQDAAPTEPTAPTGPTEPTGPAPLATALAAVRAADDTDHTERDAAVAAVLALKPSLDDIVAAFDAGLPRPAATAGWQVRSARDESGAERPYHVYVPQAAIDGEEPPALLIDMHGGVSRPEFIAEEQFARFRDTWTELADRDGFVVALPLARADCMWWEPEGVAHVLATIRDVRRRVAIDADRISATGFSDGGSGAWYLAMAAPDPFASLLPMNGHPVVASRVSEDQIYLENARLTPLFVAMTQDDQLYPGASVLPHVQELFDMKAQVHLVSYPTGGHSPSYFEDQSDTFVRFFQETVRDPHLEAFEWWTASPELGRFRWIAIDELGAAQGDAPVAESVNVMTRPGRVILGFGIDQRYEGEGVGVESVRDDSTAQEMGLQAGDVIVAIDGTPTPDVPALRRALGAKSFGEPVEVEVRRAGEESVRKLTGQIAPFTPEPSYLREQPTARIAVSREENVVHVTSRNVRRFRVLVSPDAFDVAKEIDVRANGESVVKVKVAVDLAAMLTRYAADADDARLVVAEIEVSLPSADE